MKKWTNEIVDYLHEIYLNRSNDEITHLINKKFGTNFTKASVQTKKRKLGLISSYKYMPKFTPEVIDFILKNYKGKDNVELAELLIERFNLDTNPDKVSMFKANYKRRFGVDLRTGINRGCFHKGHVPINKGTKGMFNVGGNSGSFKKGNKPQNYKPVGTERIVKGGYVEIKIADPDKWESKQRYIYKKHHGSIPEGYNVMFADKNKQNFDIDNLILVSKSEDLIMNNNKLFYEDKELTKTGHLIAKVIDKTAKLKRGE